MAYVSDCCRAPVGWRGGLSRNRYVCRQCRKNCRVIEKPTTPA